MKEIRLHGRGGQGVVKASHIVVKAAVRDNTYGQFIPFFGVERKGSPVFGFLRLSDTPIRRKTQIYHPDILMIFDDSLSAVDAETDAKIRNALKKSTGDSTVILIAHRITTLMNADVIVVLEDGKVAEIGNHAQLMENHGIYRQIYDLQSRNMETEVIA